MPLKNESGNTLPIEELYIRFDLNNKQKGGKAKRPNSNFTTIQKLAERSNKPNPSAKTLISCY